MISHVTGTYANVYAWSNLLLAYRKAAAGKRSHPPAAAFAFRVEDNLVYLHDALASGTYRPGPYVNFKIREPKERIISAAPFHDRVVHHALVQVIEPAFEASFIAHSYANRVGKGTHRAIDTCQAWLQRYRYVLPCDIRQFFPAIDHQILQGILDRRIPDAEIRWLIGLILASGVTSPARSGNWLAEEGPDGPCRGRVVGEYDMQYFRGDDLFAANRPRGLPIGNLTSQFWANCYLNEFDKFVTRELGCRAYLRYVDDFLLFADDKKTLWDWRSRLIERLDRLRLKLHEEQAIVRPTTEGVRFLGFIVFPTHRRLLRRSGLHYRQHLRQLVALYRQHKISGDELTASILGWVNHVRYGNTWGLRRAVLREVRL
jgi:retron-type reverse transcriptase